MSSSLREEGQEKPVGESYLEQVIDCISERKVSKAGMVEGEVSKEEGLKQLFGKAEDVIEQFDRDITICKKYNEAKINRKYEIVIHDLQTEIARLKHHLALEQQSRSPSKKHVSDLLEKMVALKLQNEGLTRRNQEMNTKIKLMEEEMAERTSALSELQLQHAKSSGDKLPPLHSAPLAEAVRDFLRQKEHARKAVRGTAREGPTALQKLLLQMKPKLPILSVGQLLEEVDRLGEGGKEKAAHEEEERMRKGIARKFGEVVDQPMSLLRRQQEGIWERLSVKHRQQRRFSHLDSKSSLHHSFH